MASGGYLSHGAIVAREYGIPAVVNLPGVLEDLKTGDMLVVDGDAGEGDAANKRESGHDPIAHSINRQPKSIAKGACVRIRKREGQPRPGAHAPFDAHLMAASVQ